MTKYLIDTCVWRDFYQNRQSKTGNPLGEYAAKLIMKIWKNRYKIIFSDALIWELKIDINGEKIIEMINIFILTNKLNKIPIKKEEYKEAKKLAEERNIPTIDCLNAIHARNHNAILISQDKHYFKKLFDITKPKRPQDIT